MIHPANISQKCFRTPNATLDVRLQMRQTPIMYFFCFWRNQAKNGAQTFLKHFKSWCHRIFLGSYRNEKPKGLGSFSFETLHSNVSFENRIFFERYLRAEIFEKSIRNFWSIGYFHFILDIFKI